MDLTYIPLLQLQRDLFDLPRGRERFDTYIDTMRDASGEMVLPLSALNPMGKAHNAEQLDAYLALGAEQIAAQAVDEAEARLTEVNGRFRVALVLADDAHGQWTNRASVEFGERFESKPYFRRGWLVGLLWTSETATEARVREAVLCAVYRGAYIQQNGFEKTLGNMLRQERYAQQMAGVSFPHIDEDDLAYTLSVLAPLSERDDQPTLIAALFGDKTAAALGYTPLGLSDRAGFALARSSLVL